MSSKTTTKTTQLKTQVFKKRASNLSISDHFALQNSGRQSKMYSKQGDLYTKLL